MNFLQLVQRLSSECGVAGSGPSSVASQSGTNLRLVNWTAQAWNDIQQLYNDWKFMRGSFTVNTVANDGAYVFGDCTDVDTAVAIVNFRAWHRDTFKSYLTSAGVGSETPLEFITYDAWYQRFNTGTQTSAAPWAFTIDNSNGFRLGPKPGDVYTVSGEFQHSATDLSAAADTPSLPSEYHLAIVHRAKMKYGAFYGAPEIYDSGKTDYRQMIERMELTELPDVELAGPLT